MKSRYFALACQAAILATNVAVAQPLSVDPPSQISAEIKRAEAAWSAWRASANPKLEQTILTNPNALADIARDEQGALQYLDARRRLFEKIASAFAAQIEALRTANPQWNQAAVEQVERQKLRELLATEERLLADPKGAPDPARQVLLREQRERDIKAVTNLKEAVRHRLEVLETMAGDDGSARKQLDALTTSLEQVRSHFIDVADATETEKTEWQDYFDGLRQIAVRSGVAQQGKGAKGAAPDAGAPGKARRDQ